LGSYLVIRPPDAVPTGQIEHRPEPPIAPPSLKQRGIATLFMLVIGGWILWKGPQGWLDGLLLSFVSLMLGSALFVPSVFQKIQGFVEGGVRRTLHGVSQFLFSLVFYGLVTPLGWAKRKTSKSELDARPDAELSSYWIEANWSDTYDRMY
jgi:hypothetical protein